PNLRSPMVQQWSFGVEHEVIQNLVLKLTYVGTKGDHLQESQPINLITGVVPATSLADETARLSTFQALNAGQSGGLTSFSNRIDPRFNGITLLTSSASSNYHALEFQADKAYAHGLFARVAYTFAKSIDNGSDALAVLINDNNLAQDPRNLRGERGVSQF